MSMVIAVYLRVSTTNQDHWKISGESLTEAINSRPERMLPAAAQAGSKNEPNDLIGQQPFDQVVAQGRLAASTKRDLTPFASFPGSAGKT